MSEKELKPNIRFEGFKEQWKVYKLGDIAELINGRAYKQSELLETGKYKVLRVGNFYTNDDWYYSDLELAEKYYASPEDLLYTWSASFGPHIWNGDKVIYHYHIWKVDLSNKLEKLFAVSLLEYDKTNILSDSNGSTMIHITKASLENKAFSIPKIKEQKLLGSFFEEIKVNINKREQELHTLNKFKQAMLQKMFPKEGETVPEVRFEEFEDEYINVKFDDVATIRRGASPRPIDSPIWFDDKSDVGWLRISDVTSQNGRIRNLEQKLSTKGQEKTVVLEEEHLLLSIAATVGKPLINYLKTGVHDGFIVFFNPHFDLNYMFYFLEYFRPSWNKFGQPGSQVNINSELVKNLDISLPNIKEQKLIGEYFYKLDQNIQSKQAELDKLKQFKQAMLDKMFV